MPTEIDVIEREIMAARDGAAGAEEGKRPRQQERLKKLEKNCRAKRNRVRSSRVAKGKSRHRRASEMERRTRSVATELERATRRGELAKASELQYGRIPELNGNWPRPLGKVRRPRNRSFAKK